jgi:preprotein translocase subunit YajC
MPGLIVLLFLLVLFWMLLVRPQRARARRQQELIGMLEAGDEIVSTGGLYGTITAVDGDVLHVEIADGLNVRMARRAVAGYVEPDDDAEAEPAELESPGEADEEASDEGDEEPGDEPPK